MYVLFPKLLQQKYACISSQCEGGYNSLKIAKFIIVLLLHLVLDIKICQTLKRQ